MRESLLQRAGPFVAILALIATSFAVAPLAWNVYLLLLLPLLPLLPATFCTVMTLVAVAAAVIAAWLTPQDAPQVYHSILAFAGLALLVSHLAGGRPPRLPSGAWQAFALLLHRGYALGAVLLALTIVLRGIPLPLTLAWLAFALIARRTLPVPPPPPWRKRAAAALGTLIAAGIGIGFSLAILEVGARALFTWSIPYARIFQLDTEYFARLRPNASTTYYIAAGEDIWKPVPVSVSDQGFRDRSFGPKAPNEVRIVMLGDSFVFGWATAQDETIPKYLERVLNERVPGRKFSVVNAGLSGTGVWQHRGFLNDKGFALEPDIVLHGVFPFNDITDGLLRDFDDEIEYHTYWFPDRLVSFRNRTRWPVRFHEWLRSRSLAYDVIRNRLLDDTGFLRFVNRLRFIQPLEFEPYRIGMGRDPFMEVNLEPWTRDVERGFDILQEDLEALHADCQARGVPYVVYTIPHFLDLQGLDQDLFDEVWEQGRAIVSNAYAFLLQEDFDRVWGEIDTEAQYDPGKAFRRTNAYLDSTAIRTIDIATAIDQHPDPVSLYYLLDRHFNAEGHRFVAEVLADALLTQHADLLPDRAE